MEFTKKEQKTIRDARKAIKSFRIVAYLLFFALMIFLFLSISGYLDFKTFLYPSITFIFIVSLFPGIGRGPKYVDLVNLLEAKNPPKDKFESFANVINEVHKNQQPH